MGHDFPPEVNTLFLRAHLIVKREAGGFQTSEAFKKTAFLEPKQYFAISKTTVSLVNLYRRYDAIYQQGLTDAMDIMLKVLAENDEKSTEAKKLLETAINQIADELVVEKLCAES